MEQILTTENFEEIVLGAEVPVLVDFWATWCGPCMMLAPTVEEIAKENEGALIVGKVNVDEQPALAMQFGIASIPTLLLFKDGQLVDTMIGLRSKAEIEKMFK
ncbi:MAG: thioredoxin [Clostridia bacterium]|nr:thioredoxin [Clostridia bacterium]